MKEREKRTNTSQEELLLCSDHIKQGEDIWGWTHLAINWSTTTTTTSLLYPIIHVRMDNKMSKNEHKHIYRCLRLRQQSLQHDILCLQFAILSQAAGLNSNLGCFVKSPQINKYPAAVKAACHSNWRDWKCCQE